VILVQAGAARLLRDRDPDGSRQAIETIEEVARATIGEIDRLVHALREDGGTDTGLAPLPGTIDLEALVEQHRAGGLAVTFRSNGANRAVESAVDRAAYRIVQEALTNAARHGEGAADVLVSFGSEELEIAVTNPIASGTVPAPNRHGIVGMRERAALLGGRLDAGANNGVFRVHALLPYGDTRT
jgi:signal transduction histidine kinase